VKRKKGASHSTDTSRGLAANKLSLNASKHFARCWLLDVPEELQACAVTAFRQSFEALPHNCAWANCIRPLKAKAD
jgi:hypothetical protein